MTTQEKLVNRILSIIELAEFLKNVSQACRTNGVSRQHFYDIKKAYDEHGIKGLKEKSRRKPCIKNRVAPEIEEPEKRCGCQRRQNLQVDPGGKKPLFERCL